MKLLANCLIALVLVAAAPAVAFATPVSGASAAAPSAPPATTTVDEGPWYGWQLILSDVLFLTIAADGVSGRPEFGSAELPIGLLGVALVPPAIHYARGKPRRAVLGVLVRGLAVGLYSAAILPDKGGSSCGPEDACNHDWISSSDIALIGLTVVSMVGAAIFVFIDDFFYSRELVTVTSPRSVTVVPSFSLRADGGVMGVAGRF